MNYGPKSKRPTIEIYHKMTIKALAQAMDINVGQFFDWLLCFQLIGLVFFLDIDHIYDCLIHIKNGDQYSSDHQGLWYCWMIEDILKN